MKESTRTEIMPEDLTGKMDLLVDIVQSMQKQTIFIPEIRDDIAALKQDVKTIKAAVTDTSKQANSHEHRITKLELSAA